MTWTTQQRSKAGSVAAISRGEGPLVVLIHGVGLRAEAWVGQIDELAQTHRVLAVDLPGHGDSAALKTVPRLSDYTDAIASAIDEPATIIGHSFGAMIALDLASKQPSRVTAVGGLNAIYRRDAAAKAAVASRANSLDGKHMADPENTLRRWFGTDNSAELDACRDWLRSVDPAGYRDAYRVFAQEDGPGDASLQALHCPALFLTGALEPNSTPAMSQQMANLAPHGQAQIVANAAHMLPMTHPTQVNRIIADFLKTQRI